MKRNSFLKNFTIIGSGTLVSMLISLITTPIITRIVDPVEYGQLSIFTLYSQIGMMVLCMGLDQALVRYYYDRDGVAYHRALLFRCLKWPMIACGGVSAAVIALAASGRVKFEFDLVLITLLCIYTAFQMIYRFSLLMVRLSYQTKLFSFLKMLQKAAYLVLVLPCLYFIKKDYLFLLAVCTVLALVTVVIISILAQKEVWNAGKDDPSECVITQKELLTYAYPYILSMAVTELFQAIDKLSLNMFRGYSEVGIYSSAMTLVNVFAIVQSTFNTLWAPMAVEHYTKDKTDKTFYQKGNQAITVVMFFIGISLILVKDVFALLLGEKYREAAYILPFLIFNPIMYTISETTVSGLVFMKKSKMQVVAVSVPCLTNLIGNTILVPIYGCQGAAISTGLSYILFFTMRTLLSNRYFYVDFKLGKFYLLTLVVSLYALYNTFIPFGVGAVAGYAVCLAFLAFLYRDTIRWCWQYVKETIARSRKKKDAQ